MKWQKKEKLIRLTISSVGLTSVIILLLIGFFLFKESAEVLFSAGVLKVIFGMKWYPTTNPPLFGMFPLIIGTLSVTALTALISIPLGVATAIYIAEIAGYRVKEFLNEGGLALVEQDSSQTAIGGVEGLHCYGGEAGAVVERAGPDAGNVGADGDVGEAGAGDEGKVSDVGDAVGDVDAGQVAAGIERRVSDGGDVGADRQGGQAGTVIEGTAAKVDHAVGDGVASGFALGIIDERGLVRVEQDPIQTAKGGIESLDGYRTQAGASGEHLDLRC